MAKNIIFGGGNWDHNEEVNDANWEDEKNEKWH
jgi:hypothetical protein